MSAKSINRTVQYWRIVDGKDSEPLPKDLDWNKIFLSTKKLHTKTIDGRKLTGTIHSLDSQSQQILVEDSSLSPTVIRECQSSFGIRIAADKDHIPNQQDGNSGNQAPVSTNKGWNTVDNSYVWHIPFGNIIAYVNESNSSVRATRYAKWLSNLLKENGIFKSDDVASLTVVPVLDQQTRERLKNAVGMKHVVLQTSLGRDSSKTSALGQMFTRNKDFEYVVLDTKIRVERGKSSVSDQTEILKWLNENIGDLDGFSKAAVKMVDAEGNDTEVDLIEQRITRKQGIELVATASSSSTIDSTTVFPAIIRAFNKDAKTLADLKDDGR